MHADPAAAPDAHREQAARELAARIAAEQQADRNRAGLRGQVLAIPAADDVEAGNRIDIYSENLPEQAAEEIALRIVGDMQLALHWNDQLYQSRVCCNGVCDVVLCDGILDVSIRSYGVIEWVKFDEATRKVVDYDYHDPHLHAGLFG